MNVPPLMWVLTLVGLTAIMVVDLAIIGRRPHEPSMKECGIAIGVFVSLAIIFGIGILVFAGPRFGAEFFAGYLTEYSLSMDNLFIFILIMSALKVPRHLQQFALMIGIMLALVFRGIFIALGAALVARFVWIFFVFGVFLIFTAIKLFLDYRKGEEEEAPENALLRWVKRVFPATDDYRETKLVVVENGKRLITPMLVVLVALGSTDVLFAVDSIPAIFGLTQEPYIVFTANVFALMGLRQLYFLLGGLLERLIYLSVGLSIILGFIGVKMLLEAMHGYGWDQRLGFNGEIPIWASLLVIVATLAITAIASLTVSRKRSEAESAEQPEAENRELAD
ncbi:MAG: TerC family protein [Propionibacteriaceae bacterium]|nr:TerC family protein [Propionibacteriaceae bacterium]